MNDSAINRPSRRWVFVCLIALLLATFAALSYTAVLTKSPTFDEPLQAVAGDVHRQVHDYRIDIEDPPLWMSWAILPNWNRPLKLDLSSPNWIEMPRIGEREWPFSIDTLYHTPENDGDDFIRRCRPMQIALGVAIGCILAAFTWQIGGAFASLIATVLFAFDPTLLAHSALIKNDVPIALVTLAITWLVWRLGQRATIYNITAFALASALTLTVKFSGLLMIPIAFALLIARALMPFDWPVLGRTLSTRLSRLGFAVAMIGIMAVSAYFAVWASYDFRFRATTNGEPIDTNNILLTASEFRIGIGASILSDQPISDQVRKNVSSDWFTGLTGIALQYKLMPEAWLNGLLFVNEWSKARPAFLCGHRSTTGWWYYFPLAVLFKAPLGTLLAGGALVIGFLVAPLAYVRSARNVSKTKDMWTVAVIAIPFGTYALFALTSHLNIGIRHILPLFPFGFLMLALGLSRLIQSRRSLGVMLGAILFGMLVAESVSAWPNYLAFFNAACGGTRNGIHLLSDTNLDNGQDLPLLAKWQRTHSDRKLYLAFCSLVDPVNYGIQYIAFPGNNPRAPLTHFSGEPCYLAVSSSIVQLTYFNSSLYRELLATEPIDVLGGTIYIYDLLEQRAALLALGIRLTKLNRMSDAIAVLERVVQLRPDDVDFQLNLADALTKQGEQSKAVEHYRVAVRLQPKNAQTHAKLARALAALNRSQEAVASAERAMELAHSAGKEGDFTEFNDWLKHYKINLKRDSPRDSTSPTTDSK